MGQQRQREQVVDRAVEEPLDLRCVEIEADHAGTVTAIHAENGEPVEFDQPLITVE